MNIHSKRKLKIYHLLLYRCYMLNTFDYRTEPRNLFLGGRDTKAKKFNSLYPYFWGKNIFLRGKNIFLRGKDIFLRGLITLQNLAKVQKVNTHHENFNEKKLNLRFSFFIRKDFGKAYLYNYINLE